ncbi:hypothetical protein [Burkholderia pseudomallei]|uniref:hypothetical protein n=1 Tax=Burkholderia pseudomallei TaxID=28450 RepID=UPI0011BE5698|nr:hypothetical protein [Burkholderia pseudomallei]
MTDTTASDQLCIHTDLEDGAGGSNTSRFCIPIYITNSLGVNLTKETDLIPAKGAEPKIRSGTLTFVRREGQVYGITCRHVVEALEDAEVTAHKDWLERIGDIPAPPGGHLGFRFPGPTEQIHVNARFYKAYIDPFTKRGKDLAIARIPSDTFSKINREAIPFDRTGLPPGNASSHLCGIATGFPEQSRIQRPADGVVSVLSMPTVTAWARFDAVNETSLRLYGELSDLPAANNLSGMSGGPIFWSDTGGWGLAGIVKKGLDMHPTTHEAEGMTPIFDRSKIWVEGEPLTTSILDDLIAAIPADDPAIPYWITTLIPVGQHRR